MLAEGAGILGGDPLTKTFNTFWLVVLLPDYVQVGKFAVLLFNSLPLAKKTYMREQRFICGIYKMVTLEAVRAYLSDHTKRATY